MLATVLFAGFIVFLYVPSQVFKFAANLFADLNRRRAASQIEEFLAASIPGAFLNLGTIAVWAVLGRAAEKLLGKDWEYAPVGETIYAVLAALTAPPAQLNTAVTAQKTAVLHALPRLGSYAFLVLTASAIFGVMYGLTEHRIARRGGMEAIKLQLPTWRTLWQTFWHPPLHIDPKTGKTTKLRRRSIARRAAAKVGWTLRLLIFYRVWDHCYTANKNTIYPWATRNSSVFVKLKSGLVFHGVLRSYRRTQDGEVEGILLDNVQRFNPEKLRENVANGVNPFRRLIGPLYVKWEEVADVNFAPPHKMTTIRRQYSRYGRIVRAAKKQDGGSGGPRWLRAWRVLRQS